MSNLNFLAIFLGMASTLGIFISINLLTLKKGNRRANGILAILILVFSAITFQNAVCFLGYYEQFPHLVFPFYPLNGLIGPLFYVYVLVQLEPKRRFKWTDSIHLLGFFYLLYSHLDHLMAPAEFKISIANMLYGEREYTLSSFGLTKYIARKLYEGGYVIIALLLINQKYNSLKDSLSFPKRRHFNWLKTFGWVLLFQTVLSISTTWIFFLREIPVGFLELYLMLNSTQGS